MIATAVVDACTLRRCGRSSLRRAAHVLGFVAALIGCGSLAACRRAEGGWRGTVIQRDGVLVVSNEGTGIDARSVREELKPLWTVGNGSGQPKFGMVLWADFDPEGNIYVLDHSDQKVTKLAPDGRYVTQFAGQGSGPGSLSKSGRCAFANGKLYCANSGNQRIEVFGPSGEVFPSIELPQVPVPGEIYFANQQFYVVRPFVPKGYVVYAYDRDWKFERGLRQADPVTDRLDTLRAHNTVCAAPDGLWIVYHLLNRIQKIGWDGRVLVETSRDLDWKFPKDEQGRIVPEILVHRACAVDPSGNLYVIYSNPEDWKRGNDVYKFGPDGRLREKAFTLPVFRSQFIRFDRQGNFYYSDGQTLTKASIVRTKEAS